MPQDTKGFIKKNYKFYEGDCSFLRGSTKRTIALLNKVNDLLGQEIKKMYYP